MGNLRKSGKRWGVDSGEGGRGFGRCVLNNSLKGIEVL